MVLAPITKAPVLNEDVSDDEPPNYMNVLEQHHSKQRRDFEERNRKAFANPIPSAMMAQPVSHRQGPPLKSKSSLKMLNNSDYIGVDLEDRQEGIPKQAYEYQAKVSS